jgi:hypothetical protein
VIWNFSSSGKTVSYKRDILPALGLLRASRKRHAEASPIYYGQEFRFSDVLGPQVLFEFLELIGATNRNLIRHFTVAHAALWVHPRDKNRDGITACTPDYCNARTRHYNYYRLLFTPVPIFCPLPEWNPYRAEQYFPTKWDIVKKWLAERDLSKALPAVPNLQTLRLLITPHQYPAPYNLMQKQSINNIDWRRAWPGLEVSYINLVTGKWLELRTSEVSIPDAYDENYKTEWQAFVGPQARAFFDHIKQQGLKLEEQLYDNHMTYPVSQGEQCVNADACCYTHNSNQYDRNLRERITMDNPLRFGEVCDSWRACKKEGEASHRMGSADSKERMARAQAKVKRNKKMWTWDEDLGMWVEIPVEMLDGLEDKKRYRHYM